MPSLCCDRILTFALLALLFTVIGPQGSPSLINVSVDASDGQPLTIVASASPTAGRAPLNVTFAGSASGGSPPYALFWDFGDGATAHGPAATHVYAFPGNITAEFWVQDSAVPPAKIFQSMTITVHGVGTLRVRVLDQTRNPIGSATVRMLTGPEGQELFTNQTGSDGDVDFGEVAEGVYSLEVSAAGFKNSTDTVTVLRGNPTFKEVVLVQEVGPPGLQLAPLVPYLAIAAAIIVTFAFFVLRRRRIRAFQPAKKRED